MVNTDPAFDHLEYGESQCLMTLLRQGLRCLIVGGTAVRFHGHMRETTDLDVLTGNNANDASLLSAALQQIIGKTLPRFDSENIRDKQLQIRLKNLGLEFEVLTYADGINFELAYNRRCEAHLNGNLVSVIGKSDLIVMKKMLAGQSILMMSATLR